MFVCSCNAYRDTQIADAARKGARTACEAYEALGNGPNCGGCLDSATKIVDQVHAARTASHAAFSNAAD